jgi:hypothetical protein
MVFKYSGGINNRAAEPRGIKPSTRINAYCFIFSIFWAHSAAKDRTGPSRQNRAIRSNKNASAFLFRSYPLRVPWEIIFHAAPHLLPVLRPSVFLRRPGGRIVYFFLIQRGSRIIN